MDISSSGQIIRTEQALKKPRAENVRNKAQQQPAPASAAPQVARNNEALKSTGDEQVLNQAQQFRQQAGYDQPDQRGRHAITEYLSLERESRRETIREMLGVDLFA
ncbi:hypothetical protein DXV75_13235 [Alteromonas aestuariivivens]|uniref:Uncharacterized protein n=1 Tax=Alteromonas aestuariivivens TaxID=1938339 RepID=A0A3D8M4Q9_9ALTE|nr:hypothetical protein [Alteromonas aestuariivivens]RDV24646.1 hypothetical protein DXV75_13235 [Alteromonas aestuariivivens]